MTVTRQRGTRRAPARRPVAGEARALPHRRAVLRARAPAGRRPRPPRRARRPRAAAHRRPGPRAREGAAAHRAPRRRARRDRGADARPRAARAPSPAAVERAGARAAAGAPAPRPARPADVHDRPGQRARLRRRDLGRGARRRRLAGLGPHRRRRRLRAPGSPVDREAYRRATSVYVPGAVEPMLPRGALQRRLLAGARRGPASPSPSRWSCAARPSASAAFHRSLIRSDERLDYDRVDRIFAGDEPALEPWAAPLAAARAGAPRSLDHARARAARWPSSPPSPSSPSTADGHVVAARPDRADRVAPADRAPDDRRQRAGRDAARRARRPGALPRPRAPRAARVERLVDQLASLDVPTPPLPPPCPRSRPPTSSARSRGWSPSTCGAPGHGRAALTSLVLRSLKQAHYSPRNLGHAGLARRATATSPRRSAATPTSSATARCSRRRGGGGGARRGRASRRPARGPRRASATR